MSSAVKETKFYYAPYTERILHIDYIACTLTILRHTTGTNVYELSFEQWVNISHERFQRLTDGVVTNRK